MYCSRLSLGADAAPNAVLPTLKDEDQPFVFDINSKASSQTFRLEFFDTASPTNFTLLRPSLLVLCYDISEPQSLEAVQSRWKHLVETHYNYDEALPVRNFVIIIFQRDCQRRAERANEYETNLAR